MWVKKSPVASSEGQGRVHVLQTPDSWAAVPVFLALSNESLQHILCPGCGEETWGSVTHEDNTHVYRTSQHNV